MADQKISQLTAATTPLAGTEVLPLVQSGTTKKVAVSDLTAGRAVNTGELSVTSAAVTQGAARWSATIFDSTAMAIGVGGGINFSYKYSVAGDYVSGAQIAASKENAGDYNYDTSLDFYTRASGQDPTKVLTLISDGRLLVRTNNIVIGTSGKGIDFSATGQAAGMTSELLADYEEGTWTPAFTPATGAFTTMTYSAASGRYVKVGRYVFLNASLTTSNVDVTGASGNLIITGIPFVPVTASFSGMVGANDRWNLASDVLTPRLYANTSSQILMQKNTMNAASALLVQVSDLQTGAGAFRNEIYFGISYISQ